MIRILLLPLLFTTSLASAIDFGGAKQIEDARGECVKRSKSSPAILACVYAANQQMTDLLTEAYRELKGLVEAKASSQPRLVKEFLSRMQRQQAIWPQFLDSECRLHSAGQLGSTHQGEEIEYASCVFRETKQRLGSLYLVLSK